MQKVFILLLSAAFTLSSCSSYRQFNAVATGSSLGGMFGSSIGGLMGGPRGADTGTLAGMVIGGAIGAAAAAPRSEQKGNDASRQRQAEAYGNGVDEVHYGTYRSPKYKSPEAAHADVEYIEVANVHFLDSNNNQCLDPEEEACLVMDIYNRGDRTLYNVTPNITCSSRKVALSPAATVGTLPSGQGVRYKATVRAPRRLNDDWVLFAVNFGSGKQAVVAKQFKIRVARR